MSIEEYLPTSCIILKTTTKKSILGPRLQEELPKTITSFLKENDKCLKENDK